MDDCFVPWPKLISISTFIKLLNDLDGNIAYTVEPSKYYHSENYQILNFLDIMIILNDNGKIDTDIFYKVTNTHDYLRYDSNHPVHVKNNTPFFSEKNNCILFERSHCKKSLSRSIQMVNKK